MKTLYDYEAACKLPMKLAAFTEDGARRYLCQPGDIVRYVIRENEERQQHTGEVFFQEKYIGFSLSYAGKKPVLKLISDGANDE